MEWADGEPTALYGEAPKDATEVDVTLADGTVVTAPVADGWWLAVLGEGTDPASLKQLEARTSSGASLATVPLHYAVPPPGAVTQSYGG